MSDSFKATLCARGLTVAEVEAVRAAIRGITLRDAAAGKCSHQTIANRLTRAARKLGVAVTLFASVADAGRGDMMDHYRRGGADWSQHLRVAGWTTVDMTPAELALERAADAILAAG